MRTRVQMWGNSLALRIPKSFASEVNLEPGSEVELTLVDGKLVILPSVRSDFSLDELLVGVTDSNLNGEFDTGTAAGNEAW